MNAHDNFDLDGAERPAYVLHRERLGEWAVVLILLLCIVLGLCWPRGSYRSKAPQRLPEPGAAYVQVVFSGNPLMHHPDRYTHAGPAGALSPPTLSLLPPAPQSPILAPPAYAEIAVDSVGLPGVRLEATSPLIPLVVSPSMAPLMVTPSTPARIIRLSPGLRAAQFQFEMPALVSGSAGRVSYQIALAKDGRVASLLDESNVDNSQALAWRSALLRGAGVTNASGSVEVEW